MLKHLVLIPIIVLLFPFFAVAEDSSVSDLVDPASINNKSFDSDNKFDHTVWRPELGMWFTHVSSNSSLLMTQWGLPSDQPISGDYDGDGKLDLTVWRPNFGMWYICESKTNFKNCQTEHRSIQFGLFGDYPLSGDFDGDNKSDLVVYRALLEVPISRTVTIREEGQWYVLQSSDSQVKSIQWGLRDDIPVPADYDGDKITDLAVFRPISGQWFILQSSKGFSKDPANIIIRKWGLVDDHPIAGDFDGDGHADLALWRPANGYWYICKSTNNYQCVENTNTSENHFELQFGLFGDMPIIADFDGDGLSDPAVWRPALGPVIGTWFSENLIDSTVTQEQWGLPGDVPLQSGVRDMIRRLYNRTSFYPKVIPTILTPSSSRVTLRGTYEGYLETVGVSGGAYAQIPNVFIPCQAVNYFAKFNVTENGNAVKVDFFSADGYLLQSLNGSRTSNDSFQGFYSSVGQSRFFENYSVQFLQIRDRQAYIRLSQNFGSTIGDPFVPNCSYKFEGIFSHRR